MGDQMKDAIGSAMRGVRMEAALRKVKGGFIFAIVMLACLLFVMRFAVWNVPSSRYIRDSSFVLMDLQSVADFIQYRMSGGPTMTATNRIAEAVPVLLYHGVNGSALSVDGVNLTLAQFKAQMFALKRAGWQTITLDELGAFLKGVRALPERSFLLTFDDGRRDSAYPADPVLRALGYNAVMFAISKFSLGVGSTFYLNEKDLEWMARSGRWQIESHGRDGHVPYPLTADLAGPSGYFMTNRIWLPDKQRLETAEEYEGRISGDLAASQKELEKAVGLTVSAYAYPFGEFGELASNVANARNIVLSEVGKVYSLSFFQWSPSHRYSQNFPGEFASSATPLVKRIEPGEKWTAADLLAALDKGEPKPLPYSDDLSSDRGWIAAWSDAIVDFGYLTLSPSPGETGSAVILDGTYTWENYHVEAKVGLTEGSNAYIWVRFEDDQHFAACNFGEKLIHIDEASGEASRVIRGVARAAPLPRNFTAGVRVSGRIIQCLINGEIAVESQFLDEDLDHGGIGFKTWNPLPNSTRLVVDSVRVTPL
jgi:peptidoglycan/xylan/chitin deacetylase (PgdA/CDA1 family)